VSATASPPHDADAPAPAPVGEPCPVCGAPLHPEQSWCLRCGSAARTRLAPSPNWKPPLAALAVVVALALGALAAALVDLAGGSGTVPAVTTTVTTAAAVSTPTTAPATTTAAGASTTPTTAGGTSTTKPATGTSTAGTATGATKTKGTGATTTPPRATGTSSTPTHTSTAGAKLSPTVKNEISKGAKERLEQLESKKALPGAGEK
jgi:hypothetical protein